jgi:probable F420-dependent oxidoreductase
MRFGLTIFPTDDAIAPAELGRAAEDAGFDALFFAEHTHIPAARDTPRPGDGELPPQYWHTHDPFVALATVAQTTERLRLGFGVCLITERDPIVTARAVASLDRLSGGRVEFGVGAGWNREELRNHGTDPRRRFSVMRERVQAMQAIWTQDEASFHGEHVDFDRIWCWPKPVQRPHPPVLLGGLGEKVLDRVLDYGDCWMPNRAAPAELAPRIAELRERAGRHVPVTYHGASPEAVEALQEAGVDRCLLQLPPGPAAEVLPIVERYARLL